MPRHLEQVLAHAENQLAATGAKRPTEVLPLYKKFLKIEEHRLRLKHRAGGGGREICARRVDLVDVLLRHVFNAATQTAETKSAAPLALIALGGYGRRELNPFSDVDVMVLHGGSSGHVSPYIEQVVEQILYLLWDIGFKVGHSTRSSKEAVAQANRDMLTKTAMLESRYLAGDAALAKNFREMFRTKCVEGYEREYVEMRMRDQATRHTKFGDSVYMQEPNLKNGCGGLRDYQNLLWMTYFKEGALTTTHLVGKDWLSKTDQRRIEGAYDFLLRLRTDLHYATGRATDVLHLNMQEQLAQRLEYRQQRGQLRSEAMMRDYYEHTRNIFRVTERITEQFMTGRATARTRSLFSFLPLIRADEQRLESFFVRNRQLQTEQRDLFEKDPTQMMRVFQLAQEHGLDLGADLEDLINRRLGKITRVYQYAKTPREMFMSILSRKGEVGRILRMMHRVDFLGRYLPEFGQLTCLVQHEFFHRYTADEHTLVCIDKLDALAQTENPKLISYRKLFEELEDPLVLYLALLLHDTGKAVRARPHSEASALFAHRVASRLQLSPPQRKSLVLLVDHHVTLSNMAQQRNLDDPATIVEFANIVKGPKNLNALMLLTLADGQGTSAAAWSDWKESLVWQLFHATTKYLADRKSYYEQTKIERDTLQESALQNLTADYADEVEAHFDFMPDNYFRATSLPEMVEDLKLFRHFFASVSEGERPLSPAVKWEPFPEEGHTIVSFCNWDREQLLAKIAGAFAVVPINILSVDIFARGDHTVLGVFRVCDIKGRAVADKRSFEIVEETLRSALEDETFDFNPLLDKVRRQTRHRPAQEVEFPTSIVVDNKAHPAYTLVQIQTPDRLGLLYDLLSCLGGEGVAIALSRISTQNGAAIDTFYLTDSETRGKITDSSRIAALQTHLQSATVSEEDSSASSMNALILAAGYATRLYPLTLKKAKPLLEIAGKPMIEWVLDNLVPVPGLETVYVVTNDKFASDFQDWAKNYQDRQANFQLKVVNDGTTSDDDKLGAIGDINLVLIRENLLNTDLIVIGGDNLFSEPLTKFVDYARQTEVTVGVYDVGDLEAMKKYGAVTVDADGAITHFEEKPKEPKTTLAAIALYYYSRDVLPLFTTYIAAGNNPDQPGRFLQWLYPRKPVKTFQITGKWLDIGSKETLEEANKIFATIT